MNNVKVSVVVPIYNVEKYLPRCIESLLNQTFDDYEILLVNDGSPDNCQAIIEDYSARFPDKIVALLKPNGGLSDARNYGLKYAKGEYVSFIDSDDYVDKTFLEKMYNKAVDTHSDIVVCGYYGVDEVKNTSKWFQKGNGERYGRPLNEVPELIHYIAPYAWNKLFKRSLFEDNKIEFPKGLIYEDIPTSYPLIASVDKIAFIDQPLIYYILRREGSITGTYSRKMMQLFDSLELLNNRYKELGKFEEYYNQVLFINIKHTFMRFKDFRKYRGFKLKFDFIKRGFEHLDKNFPGWQQNDYYFKYFDNDKKHKRKCYVSKYYWILNVLVPNSLYKLLQRTVSIMGKIKNILNKRHYTKYLYAYYSKNHAIDENAVLFESFHGKTISDSPFYMMKDLVENRKDKNLKIYFTSNSVSTHKEMLKAYGYDIEVVPLGSFKYAKVLATAKYLVNNVSFPTYFVRRKEQLYMNTWHGTPLKTLGKKMVQGIEDMSNMQRNFLHSTHLLFPNDFTMSHMMEDYNLYELFSGEAIVSGYPRNSIFLDTQKANEMRKRFNLEDKEVFAYMPTWRGQQSSQKNVSTYADDVKAILDKLDNNLSDNQVLYVNLHSLVKNDVVIDDYKHIHSFPNVDNYEFLNCCDLLITDYSSVFFDYSITKKPVVLFMYDYDEYMADRGMYMDVKDLPFEKIYDIDSLISYLNSKDKSLKNSSTLNDYYQQFTNCDSIDSTKVLNDYFFFGKNHGDMQIIDYSSNKDIERTIYFTGKVYRRSDCDQLERISKMKNPVYVFRRMEFNYILREYLLNELNDKASYVVIRENIAYTFGERIKLALSRVFKFINVDDLSLRLFDNILPNVKIADVICDSSTKLVNRAVKNYKKKR